MNFRIHSVVLRLILMAGLSVAISTAAEDSSTNQPSTTDKTTKPLAPKTSRRLRDKISYPPPTQTTPLASKSAPATPPPAASDPLATDASLALQRSHAALIENMDEQDWWTPEGRKAALEEKYLSSFDRNVLNAITLPLVGVPKSARATQLYEQDRRQRGLNWINDEIEQAKKTDPKEAKELTRIRNDTFARP